jgi:hypothetical protein
VIECGVETCTKPAVYVMKTPLVIHVYCIRHWVPKYDDKVIVDGVTTCDFYPEGIPEDTKIGWRGALPDE